MLSLKSSSDTAVTTIAVCRLHFHTKLELRESTIQKSWSVIMQKWPVITVHQPLVAALTCIS